MTMANSPSYEPDDVGPTCGVCGAELIADEEPCWKCHGEGGWHDCGDDCCPCLDKDEITNVCDECDGIGHFLICPDRHSHPAPAHQPQRNG